MTQIQSNKPRPGVMFGITHQLDGEQAVPVVREPKILKIGIGLPKGKAIHAYIDANKKWKVVVGYKDAKTFPFDSRNEAEACYESKKSSAPECPYPRKLPFFTFTKQAPDGSLEADFDAIAAHGPMPTAIDIVFLDDDPFNGSYQMWSQTQLECYGDGINAQRIPARATNDEERKLGEEAKAKGVKYFPIIGNCWTGNCPYSKSTFRGEKEVPSPCKPSGDLKFQLARNLRVGGTAYFHTSGIRSIQQLFSAIYRFKTLTGGGDYSRGYLAGIPFKMLLRPYKTNHLGQAATQYGVSLEFRAETVEALQKNMLEQATRFRTAMDIMPAPPRLIEAAGEEDEPEEDFDEAAKARMITTEFYPEDPAPKPPVERVPLDVDPNDFKPASVARNQAGAATIPGTVEQPSEPTPEPDPPAEPLAAPVETPKPPPQPSKDDTLRANLLAQINGFRVDLGDRVFTERVYAISSAITIETLPNMQNGQLQSILTSLNKPAPTPQPKPEPAGGAPQSPKFKF